MPFGGLRASTHELLSSANRLTPLAKEKNEKNEKILNEKHLSLVPHERQPGILMCPTGRSPAETKMDERKRHVMVAYLVHGVSISGFNGPGHISVLSQMLKKNNNCVGELPVRLCTKVSARRAPQAAQSFISNVTGRQLISTSDPSAGSTT